MRKAPDKPCEGCEHAPCQLPLNCGRWLRYQQDRRQYQADAAALRLAKLRKRMAAPLPPSLEERRKRLAEACPWVRKEEAELGKRVDYEQVRALYSEGLTDSAIAERMGVTRGPVCQWRKKNGLPPNGPAAEPVLAAPPDAHPDALDRARQLLALVRPGDSAEARELTAQLAGQWILDELKGAGYGTAD